MRESHHEELYGLKVVGRRKKSELVYVLLLGFGLRVRRKEKDD